jgi:hypothetical protein
MVGNAAYAFTATGITDLSQALSNSGVSLDTSGVTNPASMFASASSIRVLPILDFSNCTSIANLCNWCMRVHTIEKIILSDMTTMTSATGAFTRCDKLENIEIGGFFACSVSFADSPLLTKQSIESIMLSLSESTTGKTATLNKKAIDKAYETAEGANDGSNSEDWLGFVAYKSNWTISLV